MKIITEPTIYLMGSPQYFSGEMARFLHNNEVDAGKVSYLIEDDPDSGPFDDTERHIEAAGRVCYMSFDKPRPGGTGEYVNHIIEVGHGSVLEHVNVNILIEGISRSCSHEIVRHRAGFGYSQLSQRYVDESVAEYVMPWAIQRSDQFTQQDWKDSVDHAHQAYIRMVKKLLPESYGGLNREHQTMARKEARQAARSLLPNATETKIYMTGNLRAWKHFVELRGTKHAEEEVRMVAKNCLSALKTVAPHTFATVIDEGYIQSRFPKT